MVSTGKVSLNGEHGDLVYFGKQTEDPGLH